MILPRRIAKLSKRASRWRSQAHCAWVRGFECCVCGTSTNIAAAHVRLGTQTGMGQKPDDWRVVPLCDGLYANVEGEFGCHNRQHAQGEQTFWKAAKVDPEGLIRELIKASPRRREIEQEMKERGK